jgi:hypothetical protein
MAAKKLTREEMVNYIKKNLGVFQPRAKADANKFDKYESADDKTLVNLYKVIQGCVRRKNQREAAETTATPSENKSNKKNNKKNDIFKKFGLDKGADLVTLQSYLKDANSLVESINARITTHKTNRKAELEKQLEKVQKELEAFAE